MGSGQDSIITKDCDNVDYTDQCRKCVNTDNAACIYPGEFTIESNMAPPGVNIGHSVAGSLSCPNDNKSWNNITPQSHLCDTSTKILDVSFEIYNVSIDKFDKRFYFKIFDPYYFFSGQPYELRHRLNCPDPGINITVNDGDNFYSINSPDTGCSNHPTPGYFKIIYTGFDIGDTYTIEVNGYLLKHGQPDYFPTPFESCEWVKFEATYTGILNRTGL